MSVVRWLGIGLIVTTLVATAFIIHPTAFAGNHPQAAVQNSNGLKGGVYPAPGTLVGSLTFSQNCGSGIGVGITYDGTYLWVSCYLSNPDLLRVDPATGTVLQTYNIESGLGSLAYDSTRNAIWGADGCGAAGTAIQFIQLDASKTSIMSVTSPFDPGTLGLPCLVDGLAIDDAASPNILYYSPDTSTTVFEFSLTGVLVTSFPWTGTGCYNSGLGIGGNLLFQGSDGCSHVWVIDKVTHAPAFDFATPAINNHRDESLTCDPNTFSPVQVMWSKEAYTPNTAYAFAIPAGTCGSGGLPPPSGTFDTDPPAWTSGNLCSSISYPGPGDITCVSLVSQAPNPLWWNFTEVPAKIQGGTVTVDIFGSADCINLNFHSFYTTIVINLFGSVYACASPVGEGALAPGINIVINSEGDSLTLNQMGSQYDTNLTVYGTTTFVSDTQSGSFDNTTVTYIGWGEKAQVCPSGITDLRVHWSEVSYGSYNTFNTIFVDGTNVVHPPANYAYSTEPLLPPDGMAFGTGDLYGNETTQTAPPGTCGYLGT